MTEIYTLDLDFDLINHLAISESIDRLMAERFSAELLEDHIAALAFQWQLDHIREHGKPATGSVLEDTFPDISLGEPLTAIDDLIDRLRERYIRNQGREKIIAISELAVKEPLSVAKAMLDEGRELADMTQRRGEVFGTGDFDRLMVEYDKLVLKGKGPSLGFEEVDNHFFGQLGLTFLIAAPKTYKSWLTIQAVISNVCDGQYPYLYSLELPAAETNMRLHCMAAGVPWWRYLKRSLLPEHKDALRAAADSMNGMGIYRIEKPQQGHRGVYDMVQRARDAGATAIYIDQLQYLEARNGRSLGALNDTKYYFEVINDLRDLSDEGPIFVVHQFNRSVMNSDKMPEMQQVKGSSAIEEVGTLALGVWANKDMRRSNLIELGTLLSRNHNYASWEVKVDLTRDCTFDILGPADA